MIDAYDYNKGFAFYTMSHSQVQWFRHHLMRIKAKQWMMSDKTDTQDSIFEEAHSAHSLGTLKQNHFN